MSNEQGQGQDPLQWPTEPFARQNPFDEPTASWSSQLYSQQLSPGQLPFGQPPEQSSFGQPPSPFGQLPPGQPPYIAPILPAPQPRRRRSRRLVFGLLGLLLAVVLLALIPLFLFVFRPQPQPLPPTPPPSGPPTITADFASRQGSNHAIPSAFLGINGVVRVASNSQVVSYLKQTHMTLVRVSVDMLTTFPTPASLTNTAQQSWTQLDGLMTFVQSQGLQPILLITYTPSWLQPQNNSCTTATHPVSASHVNPSLIQNGVDVGPRTWGALAAQVVAHMDQHYASVHPYYEIWNEPDGVNFLCATGDKASADLTRLHQYEAIYAAAASQMKQQAQRDSVHILVGGPTLAFPRGHAKEWISAFVKDAKDAPYIDFISYHHYLHGGPSDTWDMLLQTTQGATGVAAEFAQISAIVRSGKQPKAQSTPIFIDEYNTNTGAADCCRNENSYGPLWNALFVADLFNTVTTTDSPQSAAQAVPGGIVYFAANQPTQSDHFCLFGALDSAMDCGGSGTSVQPYPQYYTYQLLGDPQFLDMSNSGHVTIARTSLQGVVVTSFYTSTKDNVFIVNTSGKAYTHIVVSLEHPGSVQTTAALWTLNSANPHIGTQSVSLTESADGYRVSIDIPAYSTVALSANTNA